MGRALIGGHGSHHADRLPSQLSGGEKQRVAIARAFVAKLDIVLCDEVTSALDVSVQAAVLQLLDRLKRERGTTYVFVSHDLAVVRSLSDRVAVLYQGRLCELGPAKRVYASPSHPYTDVLLGAVLKPHPDFVPELAADDMVELAPPAAGCPFQRRCPKNLEASAKRPRLHGGDTATGTVFAVIWNRTCCAVSAELIKKGLPPFDRRRQHPESRQIPGSLQFRSRPDQ